MPSVEKIRMPRRISDAKMSEKKGEDFGGDIRKMCLVI